MIQLLFVQMGKKIRIDYIWEVVKHSLIKCVISISSWYHCEACISISKNSNIWL